MELVNSPGKRTETFTTSLGQTVDATVSGFEDGSLRFDQLVLAINEGERLLGVPYPSPIVTMRRVTEVSGGFCGNNQTNYAPRYAGDSYAIKLDFTQNPGKVMDDITFVRSHWWLVSEGFSLSTANSDVQKLPATLYHRIADSLAYAA